MFGDMQTRHLYDLLRVLGEDGYIQMPQMQGTNPGYDSRLSLMYLLCNR